MAYHLCKSDTIKTVDHIYILRTLPGCNEAERILHCLAADLEPLMETYGARIHELTEQYPDSWLGGGCNIGRGHRVYIVLREKGRPDQFLPYMHILAQFLHELAHNFYNHGQNFDRLLGSFTDWFSPRCFEGLEDIFSTPNLIRFGVGDAMLDVAKVPQQRVVCKLSSNSGADIYKDHMPTRPHARSRGAGLRLHLDLLI
ncbi:hypothetical protein EV182_001685 [Spiromyces aspiralis]|uniref:Uncharacterized protein n=1 Tax=Spiromyces aspiralis TaxID=68401 RepID=A0ACC1HWX7_9FUNG|nr:hypothetical protein EV182_001685 [Spiromyces aspiralis]